MGIKETVLFVKKKAFGTYLRDAMRQILKRRTRFLAKKPIAHKTAVENIEAMTKRVHRSKTIFSQVQEDWSTKLLG